MRLSGRRSCGSPRRPDAPASASPKGVFCSMDFFMAGTLCVSFGLVWLLVRWCQKQLDDPDT